MTYLCHGEASVCKGFPRASLKGIPGILSVVFYSISISWSYAGSSQICGTGDL